MRYRALEEAWGILAALGAAWLIAWLIAWLFALAIPSAAAGLAGGALSIAILFTLYFFRDPERVPPPGDSLALAPADGLVTTVDEVEEKEFLNARVRRVGIFLSVLDVHINRAPIAGNVLHSEPKPGRFLDARNPDCSLFNVSRSWVIAGPAGTVLVRQITGAIARRICPWAVVGDALARGERFGMIRFGSRTELLVPMGAEILVQPGDRVRAGETPVARMPAPSK
ncbi:MAG: phosphatidylserine decarboxylase [Verrucomicrobiae bacterium]